MKIRSTAEMRDFLIQAMMNVAEGKQEPATAKAVCNYAQQIYNTVNLELKFAALAAKGEGLDIKALEFRK